MNISKTFIKQSLITTNKAIIKSLIKYYKLLKKHQKTQLYSTNLAKQHSYSGVLSLINEINQNLSDYPKKDIVKFIKQENSILAKSL